MAAGCVVHRASSPGVPKAGGGVKWRVARARPLLWCNMEGEKIMWLLVAREPMPDAPYWPGRGLLAAVDAVAWPLLWVLAFSELPAPVGLVGPFVSAVALLAGLGRLHGALWLNHRYRFTTWRWGRIAAAFVLVGWVMKAMLVV